MTVLGGFNRGSQLAAQVAAGDCHARQPTPSGVTDQLLPLTPIPMRDSGSHGPQSPVLAAGPLKVFVKFKEWRAEINAVVIKPIGLVGCRYRSPHNRSSTSPANSRVNEPPTDICCRR